MYRRYSMAIKLPVAVFFACLILGFLSTILLSSYTSKLSSDVVIEKSELSVNQLVELIRSSLFNDDTISVQVALRRATADQAIFSASVYDNDNQLIAQSKTAGDKPDTLEIISRDIELQNTQIGTIYVAVDSQPIYQQYRNVLFSWLLLWLLFTALCTYLCHQFADQFFRRILILTSRLPGTAEPMIDEISALEARIQPLLASSSAADGNPSTGYYYSLVCATVKNRQRLNAQLNRENLERLLDKIDYCTQRALELYGGQRVEGGVGDICFYIRSTQSSKQHLLVCLMAVYSLQQLLERLGGELGVDLEINWALCSDDLPSLPLFSFHEGLAALKHQSRELSGQLQEGLIGLYTKEYDIDQLSSIARFQSFDDNCFILQGFPEERQKLLEKQILHLVRICL